MVEGLKLEGEKAKWSAEVVWRRWVTLGWATAIGSEVVMEDVGPLIWNKYFTLVRM